MAVEPTPLSASNPRLADLRRLSGRRRSRLEAGRFVIEGPVPILELLEAGADIVELVVDLDAWLGADDDAALRRVTAAADDRSIPTWGIASDVFASISDTNAPQGAMAIVTRSPAPIAELLTGDGPVLVVVDLSDPGNAGTAIRTAEAAGCCGVIFAGRSTDPFGPKAVRAAAGSIARLPIAEHDDLDEVLAAIAAAGRRSIATVVRGGSAPDDIDLAAPIAILVGSEAHGLDPSLVVRCDGTATIPMAASVESINVATASAVVLFEAARQRRIARPTS